MDLPSRRWTPASSERQDQRTRPKYSPATEYDCVSETSSARSQASSASPKSDAPTEDSFSDVGEWLLSENGPWIPSLENSTALVNVSRSRASQVIHDYEVGSYRTNAQGPNITRTVNDRIGNLTTMIKWVEAWLLENILSGPRQQAPQHAGNISHLKPNKNVEQSPGNIRKRGQSSDGNRDGNGNHAKKKKGEEDDDQGSEDGDGATEIPPAGGIKHRYACPFYKRNPSKYGRPEWSNCRHDGWPDVHRLKQHLYRKHALPVFQCPRCFEDQGTQASLDAHLRAPTACPPHPQPEQDGLNATQIRALKKRSKTGMTEIEKWHKMYRICFPEDESIPNPYQTNSADAFCQYLFRELPALVRRRSLEAMGSSDNAHLVDPDRLSSIVRESLNELYGSFCAERRIHTNNSSSSIVPEEIDGTSLQRTVAVPLSPGTMASDANDNPGTVDNDMGIFDESPSAFYFMGSEFNKAWENFSPDYQQAFPGEFEGHYGA